VLQGKTFHPACMFKVGRTPMIMMFARGNCLRRVAPTLQMWVVRFSTQIYIRVSSTCTASAALHGRFFRHGFNIL
jgi:hypothetical protein